MATGLMQVSPAPFTGPLSATLPVYVPPVPVPGATAVYNAQSLRYGNGESVNSWASVDGKGPILTPSGGGAPSPAAPLMLADNVPAVRFVAASRHALGAAFPSGQPRSLVVVGKIRDYSTGVLQGVVGSGQNPSALGQVLGILSTEVPRTYAGTALNLSNTRAGTGWHVWIAVFSGDNSVIAQDGAEATGPAGTQTSSLLTVGNIQGEFSNLDVREIISYPFALTKAQRDTITTTLRDRHGI